MKSNLENLKIHDWSKYGDKFTVGLDYLRLAVVSPIPVLEGIMKILFSDKGEQIENSNHYIDNVFGFTWVSEFSRTGKSIKASYSYNGITIPIFFYDVYFEGSLLRKDYYARFDIYGGFFRLLELGEFELSTFDNYFNCLGYRGLIHVTRLDYRIDFFSKDGLIELTDEVLFPVVHDETLIDMKVKRKSDLNYGFTLGQKIIGRYYVRYYNKLKDVLAKGKQFYYGDYLAYNDVYRLEVQFNRKYCDGVIYHVGDLEKALKGNISNSSDFDFITFYNHIRGLYGLSNYIKHVCYDPRSTSDINDYNKSRLTKNLISLTNKFLNANINPLILTFDSVLSSDDKLLKNLYFQQLHEFHEYLLNPTNLSEENKISYESLKKKHLCLVEEWNI